MRGMELWRPDWAKINGEYGDPNAAELVQVTHETARIALGAIKQQCEDDYYENYGAARDELMHVLNATITAPEREGGK